MRGYDAAAGKVFYGVNGTYSSTVAANHPVNNALPLRIGGDNAGYRFTGSIDDIRIYNRALSTGEVYELYASAQSLYLTGECNDTTATLHP